MGNNLSSRKEYVIGALSVSAVSAVSLLLYKTVGRKNNVPKEEEEKNVPHNEERIPTRDVQAIEIGDDDSEDEDETMIETDIDGWKEFSDENVGLSFKYPVGVWDKPERKVILWKTGVDSTSISFRPPKESPEESIHHATVRILRPGTKRTAKQEALARADVFRKILSSSPEVEFRITHKKTLPKDDMDDWFELECQAGEYSQFIGVAKYPNATLFFEEARQSSVAERIVSGMFSTHKYTEPTSRIFLMVAKGGFEFTLPVDYIAKSVEEKSPVIFRAYTENITDKLQSETGGMSLVKHDVSSVSAIVDQLKGEASENFRSLGPFSAPSDNIEGEIISFSLDNGDFYLALVFSHENKGYSLQFFTEGEKFTHAFRKNVLRSMSTLRLSDDEFIRSVNTLYGCSIDFPNDHRVKELYGDYFQSVSNQDCSLISTFKLKKFHPSASIKNIVDITVGEFMQQTMTVMLKDGRKAMIRKYSVLSQSIRKHQCGQVGQVILQTVTATPNTPKRIVQITLIPANHDNEKVWFEVQTQSDAEAYTGDYANTLHGSFSSIET